MTDETRLVSSPVLQRMKTMDVERAHEILDSADAYRLLGERLDMLCAQVIHRRGAMGGGRGTGDA